MSTSAPAARSLLESEVPTRNTGTAQTKTGLVSGWLALEPGTATVSVFVGTFRWQIGNAQMADLKPGGQI